MSWQCTICTTSQEPWKALQSTPGRAQCCYHRQHQTVDTLCNSAARFVQQTCLTVACSCYRYAVVDAMPISTVVVSHNELSHKQARQLYEVWQLQTTNIYSKIRPT